MAKIYTSVNVHKIIVMLFMSEGFSHYADHIVKNQTRIER